MRARDAENTARVQEELEPEVSAAQDRAAYRDHLGPALGEPVEPNPGTECSLGSACGFKQLRQYHKCHADGCDKKIHNLCAQSNNLCSAINELDMYCSLSCKNKSE